MGMKGRDATQYRGGEKGGTGGRGGNGGQGTSGAGDLALNCASP